MIIVVILLMCADCIDSCDDYCAEAVGKKDNIDKILSAIGN